MKVETIETTSSEIKTPAKDSPPIEEFKMEKEQVMTLLEKDHLLTDITHLLVYPQKVAAAMLGIKEAILNKRFKEVTNRKWPFRYLAKIENELQNCKNEEEKTQLLKKKEKLLAPVYIMLKNNK